MNISKYLLVEDLIPEEHHSNESSIAQLSTNRYDPELLSEFQIFSLKQVQVYSEKMMSLYHQSVEDGKNLLFITYGAKNSLLSESLNGINQLFSEETLLRQKLYHTTNEELLSHIVLQKIQRLSPEQSLSVELRLYEEEQSGEQIKLVMTVVSRDQLQILLSKMREIKQNEQPLTTCVTTIRTHGKSLTQQQTICLLELNLCTKQLSIQYQIILNYRLDSIYKLVCKNDRSMKQDCLIINDIQGMLDYPTNVCLIGYALTSKSNHGELNRITDYLNRFRVLNEFVKKELLLQHWKPIYTKQLRENLEGQVEATRRQVNELKNKLRYQENEVMNIWCGQLHFNKTLIFEPNIKKIINCEDIKNDVAEILQIIEEYQQVKEEAELLEERMEEVENLQEFYDWRRKPVTQSAQTKKDFQEIRKLEAEIQEKEREILRRTEAAEFQNISNLPTMSIAPKTITHPQSAQVKRSQSNTLQPRPMTGIPPSSLPTMAPNMSIPQRGSIFANSRTISSRTNLQSAMSNNDQKALAKAYSQKFKIQRQNYIKSHQTIMKNMVECQDKKIEKRKQNLKIAVIEARKIIEKESKMVVLKDLNPKNREHEEEMLKKQVESNKILRRYSRTTIKRSLGNDTDI